MALSLDRHFAPIFNWSIHFKYAIAAKGFEGFVGVVVSSAFLFFSALGVIPLLLLVFQKTKNIGGLISILVGVFGIVTQFGIISGIFLIIAGILALWKKYNVH